MTTPNDHSSDEDPDRIVDELAKRAGASMRRPAPEGGAQAAMAEGVKARRRIAVGAVVAVGLLAIGGFAIANRHDGKSGIVAVTPTVAPPVGSTTPAAVTTTAGAPVTTASTPTSAAATTTLAPTTTTLADRLNQWALNYVGGTAGAASGTPVRIGVADMTVAPMQAAAKYLNAELGGIGGRPVELDVCTWTNGSPTADADPAACGTRFANDPTITLVISGLNPKFLGALGTAKPRFGAPPVLEDGIVSYDIGPRAAGEIAEAKLALQKAGPSAKKVLVFTYPGNDLATRLAPWLQGVEVVPLTWNGADTADTITTKLKDLNATDVDAVIESGGEADCQLLRSALETLKMSPVVVTNLCGSPVEGWYYTTVALNGSDPSYDTGAATAMAKLTQYGVDPLTATDDPQGVFGDDPFWFADVLTAAKIINGVGGPDKATSPVLRQALLDFKGPAMLTGPQDCSFNTKRDKTYYPLALGCQKTVSVLQAKGGKYVELPPVDITAP